jgi:hypothetical protein
MDNVEAVRRIDTALTAAKDAMMQYGQGGAFSQPMFDLMLRHFCDQFAIMRRAETRVTTKLPSSLLPLDPMRDIRPVGHSGGQVA